jgi:hypothetical protein
LATALWLPSARCIVFVRTAVALAILAIATVRRVVGNDERTTAGLRIFRASCAA